MDGACRVLGSQHVPIHDRAGRVPDVLNRRVDAAEADRVDLAGVGGVDVDVGSARDPAGERVSLSEDLRNTGSGFGTGGETNVNLSRPPSCWFHQGCSPECRAGLHVRGRRQDDFAAGQPIVDRRLPNGDLGAPAKFLPVTVTFVPPLTRPRVGEILVTDGGVA